MLNNKAVLITGGTGSFGKKFVETILRDYPAVRRIVIYSRDELKQFELKQKYPIFNVRLYKNHKFLSSNIASVISYISIFSVSTIINYHFQYILGWNAQMTGLILISMPVMQAIVTPQSGKLSDLINPQKLSALGMGLATIAILILTTMDDSTSVYIIIIALMIGGVGYGLFSSPNTNTIMSSDPTNETTIA